MADAPRLPVSGAFGPDGEPIYTPDGQLVPSSALPAWLRELQPYSMSLPATVEGLMMSTGMTGGPRGAVLGAGKSVLDAVAASPMARYLMTGMGLGGAGAVAASPTQAGPGADVAPKESVAPTAENLTRLYEQQSVLQRQTEDARIRREAERKTGTGPKFQAADQEFQALSRQLEALNRVVLDEQRRNSPEYALEQKRLAEQDRIREANRPWRERNPELAAAWPYVVPLAAAAGGAVAKGGERLSSYLANRPWHRAVAETRQSLKVNDPSLPSRLQELKSYNSNYSPAAGESKLPLAVGAATGAELGMLPMQTDVINLGWERAVKDPWELAKVGLTSALGAATGATAGKLTGALLPKSQAPIAASEGLASIATPAGRRQAAAVRREIEKMGLAPAAPGTAQPSLSTMLKAGELPEPTPAPTSGPSQLSQQLKAAVQPANSKAVAEREWKKATSEHHSVNQPRDNKGKFITED